MIDLNQLAKQAKQLGAAASGIIKTSDLRISEEFRTLCEQNTCGKYGTTWMCPPNIAPFEEAKAKVLGYTEGVVFQTVHALEDSFDYEGMLKGAEVHWEIFCRIQETLRSEAGGTTGFALNAGACRVCKKCAHPDPCRFPNQAVPSIESHCIDIYALLASCDIPYNNGPNTVFYAGLFLF